MDTALNRIVSQEPNSVATLFRHYGYDASPTAKNLQNLLTVHGQKPLPFSNATGTAPKKSLATILEMVKNGITTVSDIVNVISGKATVTPGGQMSVGIEGASQPNGATERVLGMDRKLFISLSIILLIVVAFLFFRKK